MSGMKTCLLFASVSAKSNLASGWKHVVRESSECECWTNSRLQEKDWHRITSGHIPLPPVLLCVSHVHIKIQLLSDQAPIRSAKQHHSLLLFSCKHFPPVGYSITPSKRQNNNNVKAKVLTADEVVLLDGLFSLMGYIFLPTELLRMDQRCIDCRVREPFPPWHCHSGMVSTVIETPALIKSSAKSN